MIRRRADSGIWTRPAYATAQAFDFSWHPDPTDPPYIYQFGTQWQKTGGPRYVVPGATEIKYVDQLRVDIKRGDAPAIVIDHLDGAVATVVEQVSSRTNVLRSTRFVDNYLDTLRRIANSINHDGYLWICSSVCDYQNFDFTWHPEQWQALMLHVFASEDQKFGDTFFMHVPSFRSRSQTIQLLDWYDINFVDIQSVPRRPMPVVQHAHDSHVLAVPEIAWSGPLAVFTVKDFVGQPSITVPLWRTETRAVTPLDRGGSTVIIPRDAVSYIKSQIYDYPYINRNHLYLETDPFDVVFVSNGEHCADHHYEILQESVTGTLNKIHRIDHVNGRVAAYQAAAKVSTTAWFFAVFAKLQVNEDFDWGWQPDRLQQAKHYIFHAYNPVNHLIYGHQAMIAYNKQLVLTNNGHGLDFTLDQLHEVVPILSGTAYYDCDPWTCWRTAFRECLKLRHSLPDVENQYRLDTWLTVGEGTNACWSLLGASDAVEYYKQVQGDMIELRRSYEWDWLASYALLVRPELFAPANT